MFILSNIWKVHDTNPWQNNFINEIQIHNQSPSMIQSHGKLSKSQILIGNIKSLVLIGNIKKPNPH